MNEERTTALEQNDTRAFNQDDVEIAIETLQEYSSGKTNIDAKATANQEWWRMRHWGMVRERNMGVREGVQFGSAWLVNSLLNKHADIMDSLPKPNILPREADDELEAQKLTEIIPLVLEQNDYEEVYRRLGWDICIDGSAITGVFWDQSKADGLGDVAIQNVDVHNIFWKPGIQDLQDSDRVYYVTLEDIDDIKAMYPEVADKIGAGNQGIVKTYIHDDSIDTSNCAEIINMYYKKTVSEAVMLPGTDEEGNPVEVEAYSIPKTVLHLAIIVGDELVFCSENEPGYEDGFYEHGKYPFVIRRLFPIKDTPWGFGYLDIMKNSQKDIDKLDQAIIRNAVAKSRTRYWAKKNTDIDIDQFADWDNEIVEVGSGNLGDAIRLIDVPDVPNGAMSHLMNKINELKETSGNRDFSQGSTAAGVTAASAIAALQEAGSKLSRDINKELYRGSREEYYLVIELIRQFYTEPRSFRLSGEGGQDYRFELFSNAGIVAHDVMLPDGTVRHKRPMFDIMVTAEKQSPFSRAAQNELAKELYGMGMFVPENAIPALTCIDMMDFEGKEKVRQQIQQNATMLQQFQAAMQLIQQLAGMIPGVAQMAAQMGLIDPAMLQGQPQEEQGAEEPENPEIEEPPSKHLSYAEKIRQRSANAANPG